MAGGAVDLNILIRSAHARCLVKEVLNIVHVHSLNNKMIANACNILPPVLSYL